MGRYMIWESGCDIMIDIRIRWRPGGQELGLQRPAGGLTAVAGPGILSKEVFHHESRDLL